MRFKLGRLSVAGREREDKLLLEHHGLAKKLFLASLPSVSGRQYRLVLAE